MFPVLVLLLAIAVSARPEKSVPVAESGQARVGQPLPDFAGLEVGRTVALNREEMLKGLKPSQRLVMVFFQSTCAPCLEGMRELRDHQAELERAGVRVLLVGAGEDRVATRRILARERLEFSALADPYGVLARTFGLVNTVDGQSGIEVPCTVVTDHQGKVLRILKAEGQDYLQLLKAP